MPGRGVGSYKLRVKRKRLKLKGKAEIGNASEAFPALVRRAGKILPILLILSDDLSLVVAVDYDL
jgi:hypothetical protein